MSTVPESPNQNNPSIKDVPFILRCICTGFGAGYSPFVPGTVGTAVALFFYLIPGFEAIPIMLSAIIAVFTIGTYGAHRIEKHIGHDPGIIVIDEIVGMWVSLLFLPKMPILIAAAFILFRIADIIKPWPASWCQRKSGGWAIMLDDVIAGMYVNIVLWVCLYCIGYFFSPL
jgi:phosphatidylglycerophosphatase A